MSRRNRLVLCGAIIVITAIVASVIGGAQCGFQCFYTLPIGDKPCPELQCWRYTAIGAALGAAAGGLVCLTGWKMGRELIQVFRGRLK